jgi:serine/threonine protein kinase
MSNNRRQNKMKATVQEGTSPAAMPRIDSTIDFDAKSPPFDQFKGIHRLARDRRGHVSVEHARHQLYVGNDSQNHTNVLIKVTAKPGLVYQENLENEIASLLTVNRSLPESRYFPFIQEHGKLRDGRVYIVESFFIELPLATAIGKEPIPRKTSAYLRTAMEIAKALGDLHTLGICHVDLNPMNILFRLEHDRPIVRIIDFESSYERARHSAGAFYNPPNTPGYSAPEISREAPGARSDVFSLGAVLYTMLAGYEWTWEADVWRCVQADRDLDPDLKRILLQAVDPNPDNRYPSMKEFHATLAAHLAGT